jgi:Starch-binding associating with outer membrane
MKRLSKLFLLVLIIGATSCDLDKLQNPNQLVPSQADPNYLLNTLQLGFQGFFLNATQFGMDNTRMLAMGGDIYPNAYGPESFDGMWFSAYSGFFINSKNLKEIGAKSNIPLHTGIAKVLEAYTLVTLVDYFGDVPYSEALGTNLNPKVDDDASLYTVAFGLIDDAIVDFGKINAQSKTVPSDLYYPAATTNATKSAAWKRVANTLKLKMLIQTRLVDTGVGAKITTLLAEDLIDVGSEDFQFNYPANSFSAPNNYHPWFMGNYQNGANQYQSNYYMNQMINGKAVRDPRLRYYYYRQTLTTPTDVNVLNCAAAITPPAHYPPGTVYCVASTDGYFGRDHLDPSGTPPDTKLRTIYGVYPAGGKHDNNQGVPGAITDGAVGKGILPILLASFTSFMKAEASQALGLAIPGGDARFHTIDGVTKAIAKVNGFGGSPAMSATSVANYITAVGTTYDAATDKLNVIMTEYWQSAFGNGVEPFNGYRRTGKPTGLQPSLAPDPGQFFRSFYYPSVFVNRNANATPKANGGVKVFWDTNADGFIK